MIRLRKAHYQLRTEILDASDEAEALGDILDLLFRAGEGIGGHDGA